MGEIGCCSSSYEETSVVGIPKFVYNEWGVGEVSVNGGSIGSCRKREE